jgi:hypothetical protein
MAPNQRLACWWYDGAFLAPPPNPGRQVIRLRLIKVLPTGACSAVFFATPFSPPGEGLVLWSQVHCQIEVATIHHAPSSGACPTLLAKESGETGQDCGHDTWYRPLPGARARRRDRRLQGEMGGALGRLRPAEVPDRLTPPIAAWNTRSFPRTRNRDPPFPGSVCVRLRGGVSAPPGVVSARPGAPVSSTPWERRTYRPSPEA